MAKSDPREKELDRRQGWYRGVFFEFILTKDRGLWLITMLRDGELFATFDRDTATASDLWGMVEMQQCLVESFEGLVARFLQRVAA